MGFFMVRQEIYVQKQYVMIQDRPPAQVTGRPLTEAEAEAEAERSEADAERSEADTGRPEADARRSEEAEDRRLSSELQEELQDPPQSQAAAAVVETVEFLDRQSQRLQKMLRNQKSEECEQVNALKEELRRARDEAQDYYCYTFCGCCLLLLCRYVYTYEGLSRRLTSCCTRCPLSALTRGRP